MYNNTRLVISSAKRQHTIVSNVYKGLRQHPKVKAMASHSRRASTIQSDFSGTISKVMSENLLRNMTNFKSSEKQKKY